MKSFLKLAPALVLSASLAATGCAQQLDDGTAEDEAAAALEDGSDASNGGAASTPPVSDGSAANATSPPQQGLVPPAPAPVPPSATEEAPSLFGGPPSSAQLYGCPLGAPLYIGSLGMSHPGGTPGRTASGLPVYGGYYGSAPGYSGLVGGCAGRGDHAFGIYPDDAVPHAAYDPFHGYAGHGGKCAAPPSCAGFGAAFPASPSCAGFGTAALPYGGCL